MKILSAKYTGNVQGYDNEHLFELTYDNNRTANLKLVIFENDFSTWINDGEGYKEVSNDSIKDLANTFIKLNNKKDGKNYFKFQYEDEGEYSGIIASISEDLQPKKSNGPRSATSTFFAGIYDKVDAFALSPYRSYCDAQKNSEKGSKRVSKEDSEEQNARFEEFKEQIGDLFYFMGSIVATGGTLLCALIAYAFLKPAEGIGLLGSLVIDGIESMRTPTYTMV